MVARILLGLVIALVPAGIALAQTAATAPAATAGGWHNPGDGGVAPISSTAPLSGAVSPATVTSPVVAAASSASPTQASAARVSTGSGTLPNDQGQQWREYDISPYTLRVTSTSHPEQAIIDWILRETGYEAWHSEPLAILSATPRVLRVYHTPEMQAVVADLVERFVNSNAENAFGLQVVSLSSPNWRARAHQMLAPVQVQTPGVQAWLLEKENAASLLVELKRRSDFREHSSPQLLVANGQSTVVSAVQGRKFTRDVLLRPDAWPGFQQEGGQIEEGFSLEFSPLLSSDGQVIDATLKCNIDQVEKLVPVMLEVPSAVAPRQRAPIDVPQVAQFRFHERFRWPAGKVLLVALGMTAPPVPADSRSAVAGLPLVSSGPGRAETLVFLECKGRASTAARAPEQLPSAVRGGAPRR